MPTCPTCSGTTIEYDAAAGNGFCIECGTVVEENTIVSEVTFGETSSGAAIVQGGYVGLGATSARISGPYSNRANSSESREQTIENATKKITQISNVLHLPSTIQLAAQRLYRLAVELKFTRGRKSLSVVAVCLYVACRQKEARNYMLIDFSDLLQVNVFELGHTYLNLISALNLKLPLVDPSHYISRFASLLEFGDETSKVATDAVRIVQRFDRDWMTRGRRPAGICGAALLLAARMNNFRRSVEEIVQVVKIADTTLKKRLMEFKNTPSGQLNVHDFRTVWLDEEVDPPAYTRARVAEQEELEDSSDADDEHATSAGETDNGEKSSRKKKRRKKKRKVEKDKAGKKRKRDAEDDGEAERDADDEGSGAAEREDGVEDAGGCVLNKMRPVDPTMLNTGILTGTVDSIEQTGDEAGPSSRANSDSDGSEDANIDPVLRRIGKPIASVDDPSPPPSSEQPNDPPPNEPAPIQPQPTPLFLEPDDDDPVSSTLRTELSSYLTSHPQGSQLSSALDEAETRRLAQLEAQRRAAESGDIDDELLGLDEMELDRYILKDAEVRLKERVWVEMNKDYLMAIAAKGDPSESQEKTRKRRKSKAPHDSATPSGTTAAESVKSMMKKNPKYSKRINYDALKDLLDNAGDSVSQRHGWDSASGTGYGGRGAIPFPGLPSLEEKADEDLYYMPDDEKSDNTFAGRRRTRSKSIGSRSGRSGDEGDSTVVVIQEEGIVDGVAPIQAHTGKEGVSEGETDRDHEEESENEDGDWDDIAADGVYQEEL